MNASGTKADIGVWMNVYEWLAPQNLMSTEQFAPANAISVWMGGKV